MWHTPEGYIRPANIQKLAQTLHMMGILAHPLNTEVLRRWVIGERQAGRRNQPSYRSRPFPIPLERPAITDLAECINGLPVAIGKRAVSDVEGDLIYGKQWLVPLLVWHEANNTADMDEAAEKALTAIVTEKLEGFFDVAKKPTKRARPAQSNGRAGSADGKRVRTVRAHPA